MAATARKSDEAVTGPQEWVTLSTAAREALCSRLTLAKAALNNELITDQRAGMTFVERKSLDAFIAKRKTKAPKRARAHR